ncbi:MAG: AAA family ATPase [Kangiellaceae bacterium]|nr:AAA family ATPase [Kangiellaceae bacterium]
MDYQAFVDTKKSLLVAPAGYGKTFTIVECLKYTTGKQLVLTHTHAGIAAIKEKIKKTPAIKSHQYCIETISSFAQKYVMAFYVGEDMPCQKLSKEYHKFIIEQAIYIFRGSSAQNVLEASYSGVFVDEYQDCNIDQHSMISALSNILPTHILGDYLQGIFDFDDGTALVDFNNDLNDYEEFKSLDTPYRWYQEGNNSALGDYLKTIRELLETGQDIVLETNDDIGFHVLAVNTDDIRESKSSYRKWLKRLIENPDNDPTLESLLVIVPEYKESDDDGNLIPKGSIASRAILRKQFDFGNRLTLLEAIDDKSFYSIANAADVLIDSIIRARKPVKKCKEFLIKIFNKTDINNWFNDDGLIHKTNEGDKIKSEVFEVHLTAFIENPSIDLLTNILKSSKSDLKCKYKREEILYSFVKALEQAALCNTNVSDAMIEQRNKIRRLGRKVKGKCLGTTLLTKGLEFDTVAILGAHNFDCPKHLYVAITRACKKLIIFTESTSLSLYTGAN